jgi:hypothetical protein
MPRRELAQELHHERGLLRAHARKRLVEQQHLRLRGENHRDFELALLAVDNADATRPPRRARPAASSAPSANSTTGRNAAASARRCSARGMRDCAASRQFSKAVNAGKMFVF